jgi:hypothetical protein
MVLLTAIVSAKRNRRRDGLGERPSSTPPQLVIPVTRT